MAALKKRKRPVKQCKLCGRRSRWKVGCPPVADLEGKLSELRNTMVDWTHCTPPFATNVVTEAAEYGIQIGRKLEREEKNGK